MSLFMSDREELRNLISACERNREREKKRAACLQLLSLSLFLPPSHLSLSLLPRNIPKSSIFLHFLPFFAVILANISRRKICSIEIRCILISLFIILFYFVLLVGQYNKCLLKFDIF